MLVNLKEITNRARKEKYAVPHLNINNLEWTRYILETCEEMGSPVILGVSEGAANYMGGFNVVTALVKSLMKDLNIKIPVCIHLDHGSTVESCINSIDAGFTSVMIDASKYSLEKNIEMTKQVVEYATKYNVSVEAEVGHIGGTEDGHESDIAYANVQDVLTLVKESNIDIIAPALGSVHGLYKGEPKLDFEKMKEISEQTNIPLVLHGGTGIYDEQIKKAIECGISKININTDLQIAWSNAVRKFISIDDKEYDPRRIIGSGKTAVKEKIREKILLFGSNNKY